MAKLVLFTCFNPDIGGGGVNFRTQIAAITGWEITWAYLGHGPCRFEACRAICLGPPFVGGALIPDLVRSPLLWAGIWRKPVQELTRHLASLDTDAYWVLAMNEGVLVAPELRRLTNRPVHVSVQDDQEKGMFARMSRYWWMSRLARRPLHRALRAANSVDVTSEGMRQYYRSEFGLESKVTHLVVNPFSVRKQSAGHANELTIGHIGTLYDESVAMRFGDALRAHTARSGQRVRWKLIGLAPKFRRLRAALSDLIEDLGNMSEPDALNILAKCDAVYAMYPFKESARIFRQTSFPTKLSSYLQAGRPIFAHSPSGSTLEEFVRKYDLGHVCQTLDPEAIARELDVACKLDIPLSRFETAADVAFGTKNVEVIQRCLDAFRV